MQKITSVSNLQSAYSYDLIKGAMARLDFTALFEDNAWMVREQIRMTDGTYTPANFVGDDKFRFAHLAADGVRIAYTKNVDKGRDDLQTVVSLDQYCGRFGLVAPAPVDAQPQPVDAPKADTGKTGRNTPVGARDDRMDFGAFLAQAFPDALIREVVRSDADTPCVGCLQDDLDAAINELDLLKDAVRDYFDTQAQYKASKALLKGLV